MDIEWKSNEVNCMKIINLLAVAIIATAFMECSQCEFPETLSNVCKFYDGQIEEADSRVTLDDNYMINWEKDDPLSIFPRYDVNCLYKVIAANEANASFELVPGSYQYNTELDAHYAVYPYHSNCSISNGVISTQFPAEIEYSGKENSIRHALMTAKAESNNFTFTNAMGILRLKLNAKQPFLIGKVQSIQLKSKTKGLCGNVTIDYTGNRQAPSAMIEATADNRTLTINLVNDLQKNLVKADANENYSEYYIPMAPEIFDANDLLLVIKGSSNTYSKYIGCEINIERRKIFTLTHTISALSYDGDIEN